MPRHCSICTHKQVSQINTEIAEGVSFRGIALRYGMSNPSVGRHAENCLNIDLSAYREEKKTDQAFDFATELYRLYAKAGKMVDALERWLADPDNPDEYNIDPRDSEMTVLYLDHKDLTKQGDPKQKKGRLRDLLKRIDAESDNEPVGVISSAMDNRKLYLDAFKTLNDRLEQMAKFYGLFTKEKDNPQSTEKAIEAYRLWAEKNPHADKESQADAIKIFATNGQIDETEFARQAGITELEMVQ